MKQAEARAIVWRRLATTAINDIDNCDWIDDEAEHEADRCRLLKACKQVAESIETRLHKGTKR